MPTNRYSRKQLPISRPQDRVMEQPAWHFPAKAIEPSLLKAHQPPCVFPVELNTQEPKQGTSTHGTA